MSNRMPKAETEASDIELGADLIMEAFISAFLQVPESVRRAAALRALAGLTTQHLAMAKGVDRRLAAMTIATAVSKAVKGGA